MESLQPAPAGSHGFCLSRTADRIVLTLKVGTGTATGSERPAAKPIPLRGGD
jgi:hypothetical protein